MAATRCPARDTSSRAAVAVLLLAGALGLAGCTSGGGSPIPAATPSPTASDSASPSPMDTASPGTASPGTASPGATASPDVSGTASPSSTVVQVSCGSVTVVRTGRITVGPLRTTELATVVSDGRNLTPGTRQQTDFATPSLVAPGGGSVDDPGTIAQVAKLVEAQKHRVLLQRPPAPDEDTDASKKPFSSPGTYAVYNASGLLSAEAFVQCAGQEQTWTFSAEADPATGQLNCAVEPARSNGLARSVFAQSC